jgi:hypothetical protein
MTCHVTEWLLGMQTCFSFVVVANRALRIAYVFVLLGKAHLGAIYRLVFSSHVRAGHFYSARRTHHELTDQGN